MSKLHWVALSEGVSFLVLLFVAMPLKYVFGHPEAVRTVGMIHGVLFVAFIGMLTAYATEKNWDRKTLCLGYVCAVIPFGPFWFDRKYLAP